MAAAARELRCILPWAKAGWRGAAGNAAAAASAEWTSDVVAAVQKKWRKQPSRTMAVSNADSDQRLRLLLLFDVDGTLTGPRMNITPEMESFLQEQVMPRASVGMVGGSNLDKIVEQMGGRDVLNKWDYVFAENGLVAYRNGKLVSQESILAYLGEEKLQRFLNFCLHYVSELSIPVKRGTFIEFRTGLINVCPIGRNCSREERNQFEVYDRQHHVRKDFVDALKKKFPDLGLTYSIGGQISFDVFPTGWDKTYCLRHVEQNGHSEVHFFGDKTQEGGNDHEIFLHPNTVGHAVTGPEDTRRQVAALLGL